MTRKPLFFRPGAPRPSGPTSLRQCGRGASRPAIPCSFVRGHHVHGTHRAFGGSDVVLHRPQSHIPSSGGTTSLGPDQSSAMRTWCFMTRNPLFFRPGAPRPSGPAGLRRVGRGASRPASPYSFVRGHHVPRAQRAFGGSDVVLHRPQALIPSSGGTTSTRSGGHRVPMLKTKAEGNSRPRISLPLTVGGNFPLFPTAPSPLGAAPIGKHFRPTSFPEVLPIPNPEAHSIRPGLNGLSSPQNRNGSASATGSAALLFPHNQKG